MQKFPLHLPHKVFLARSPCLPLCFPWLVAPFSPCWFVDFKQMFASISHTFLALTSLARSMIVTMSSVLNESFRQLRHPVDFPFSFSLLCVCVLLLLIFPALHWQLRPFVMRVLLLVWSLLSAYLLNHLVAHTRIHSYMYQYVGQPLISHLSWRFINSRLKINWNFIHLIILFTRSRFALFMSQYCGIHLNCMWL